MTKWVRRARAAGLSSGARSAQARGGIKFRVIAATLAEGTTIFDTGFIRNAINRSGENRVEQRRFLQAAGLGILGMGAAANTAGIPTAGIAFDCTPGEVHDIVYLTLEAVSSGGFFPCTDGELHTGG